MKPGVLVEIVGMTCPMYPDDASEDWNNAMTIGYAVPGTVCIFLGSEYARQVEDLKFHRVIYPGRGPVWVRHVWVKEVDHETR